MYGNLHSALQKKRATRVCCMHDPIFVFLFFWPGEDRCDAMRCDVMRDVCCFGFETRGWLRSRELRWIFSCESDGMRIHVDGICDTKLDLGGG